MTFDYRYKMQLHPQEPAFSNVQYRYTYLKLDMQSSDNNVQMHLANNSLRDCVSTPKYTDTAVHQLPVLVKVLIQEWYHIQKATNSYIQ